MKNNIEPTNSIIIYQTNDGETSIDVKFQDEAVGQNSVKEDFDLPEKKTRWRFCATWVCALRQ